MKPDQSVNLLRIPRKIDCFCDLDHVINESLPVGDEEVLELLISEMDAGRIHLVPGR